MGKQAASWAGFQWDGDENSPRDIFSSEKNYLLRGFVCYEKILNKLQLKVCTENYILKLQSLMVEQQDSGILCWAPGLITSQTPMTRVSIAKSPSKFCSC